MKKNHHQKPIVCFDFDGTLLDGAEQIHPADLRYLREEQTFIRFAATGRTLDSVKRVLARNELFKNEVIPFPLILMNGSAVFGFEEQLIHYTPFEPQIQSQVFEQLPTGTAVSFLLLGLKKNYLFSPTPFGITSCQRHDFVFEEITSTNKVDIPISKVMCYSDNPEALAKVKEQLSGLPIEGVYPMPIIFEFTPPGINKGKGLQLVMDGLNLAPVQTAAVGDGENDLPLLAQVDLTFAPDHAPEKVKSQAQFHIHRESTGIFAPILNHISGK